MDQKTPSYTAYPTPPSSASPSRTAFSPTNPWYSSSHRTEAFGHYAKDGPVPTSPGKARESSHRRRASSLGQRYPGDLSHRPLDIIRKQTKAADRAPHLKKNHLPRADLIDSLDHSMGSFYHHEGPYDATLQSRNTRPETSPLEAVRGSTNETLRATPRENIRDALDKHIPLQGTAVVPPGERSMSGEIMDYKEGADLMRDEDAPGGAYKRWDGMKYLPEDYKGKGEPSFSLERAINQKPEHRRVMSDVESAYEMQPARSQSAGPRSASGTAEDGGRSAADNSMSYARFEDDMRRSTSGGRLGGLKRRLGSLRRTKK